MTFDEAISSISRELFSSILFDGLSLTLNDDFVREINVDSRLINGEDFEVGTAIADRVVLDLIDYDGNLVNYNFEDEEFKLYFGINTGVVIEYKLIGIFKVEEVKMDGIKVKIVGVDRMVVFEKDYVSGLTYPQTLKQILDDVCLQAGVTLDTLTFPNDDLVVAEEPSYFGVTLRKMIAQISELAGGFAKINNLGNLEIRAIDTSLPKSITKDNYFTLDVDDVGVGLIDKVVISVGEVSEEMGVGTNPYYIVNNIFVVTPSEPLYEVFTALNGIIYQPLKIRYQGDFSKAGGTLVNIDDDVVVHQTYLFNKLATYDGSYVEVCEAPALSNLKKDTSVTGSLGLAIEQVKTEIRVMDGKIELKVDATDIEQLTGEVSKAQASIVVLEGAIVNKVSTTDLNTELEKYTTVTSFDDAVEILVGVQSTVATHGETIDDVNTSFNFGVDGLEIGKTGDDLKVLIDNKSFNITETGTKVVEITDKVMKIENMEVLKGSVIGVHKIERYGTTDITLVTFVGGES